jgi:rare lipoprotein A
MDARFWAAAIQTDLREMFGGVRHSSRASYALVEGTNKKAIIKINDVGPLVPGRVIDSNNALLRSHPAPRRDPKCQGYTIIRRRLDAWTNR